MKTITDILFPIRCLSCSKRGSYLCDECLSKVEIADAFYCGVCNRPALDGFTHPGCAGKYVPDRTVAPFAYRGPVKDAVKSVKYKKSFAAVSFVLAMALEELDAVGVTVPEDFILVPVPVFWWKRATRGFNQAEVLAQELSVLLGLEVKPKLLKKVKDTDSQTELKRDEREKNVRGAFEVSRPNISEVKGKNILLVDDVFTTGATLRECANVLKRAGASQVWAFALAKD